MDFIENIPINRVKLIEAGSEQPFNLVCEYREKPMDKFRGDVHYALQFCILLHGRMELMLDNFRREYSAGDVWWTMFWEPHAFRFTGNRNFSIAVNLDYEHLGNCDPFDSLNWVLPFTVAPALRFRPESEKERIFLIEKGKVLYKLYRRRQDPAWKIRCWLLIHDLLAIASERIVRRQKESNHAGQPENFKRIKPAIDIARSRLGRPPALAQAARVCNLSPSRFSHVFRETMGDSYGRFASRVRLSASSRDLKNGVMTIDEVAEKWGFADHSHFLHSFKKLYGCTPRQYQRRTRLPESIRDSH